MLDKETIEFKRRVKEAEPGKRPQIELEHARAIGLALTPDQLLDAFAGPVHAISRHDAGSPPIAPLHALGGFDLNYRVADPAFIAALGIAQRSQSLLRDTLGQLAKLDATDASDLAARVQAELDLGGVDEALARQADEAFAKTFFSAVTPKSGTAANAKGAKK